MAAESGWVAYGPQLDVAPEAAAPVRPELADVGRLARRGLRAVIGAARADERPRLSRILADHLGATVHDVVEETWRAFDHVNAQAGVDVWLAAPSRSFELVGVVSEHGQPVELAELLSDQYGGQPLRTAAGQGGQHQPGHRAGRAGAPLRALRALSRDRGRPAVGTAGAGAGAGVRA